jgi:hypothetical protein
MKARGHAALGLHSSHGKAVLDLAADGLLGQPYRLGNSFHHTFLQLFLMGRCSSQCDWPVGFALTTERDLE